MRIGLAFNQRPDALADALEVERKAVAETIRIADTFVEWDEPETIDAVADALSAFGTIVRLEAIDNFAECLREAGVDLLFNMAEGLHGPSREAHVPAIAEFLGVPYTASDPLALALALHKGRAKEIWGYHGIPTAPFRLLRSDSDLSVLEQWDAYPLFLKPVWEGSSKGITQANLVTSPTQATERAAALLDLYRQPVVAEAYLPGEEFTAAILGNGVDATCLPLIRYRFEQLPADALPLVGFEAKWLWDQPGAHFDILECPASVSPHLARALRETAVAAYQAIGCRDWARVDLRLDAAGTPNVIEVNPLPGVIPDPEAHSCFPRAAAEVGMSHAELIQRVVRIAWQRIAGVDLMEPTLAGAVG